MRRSWVAFAVGLVTLACSSREAQACGGSGPGGTGGCELRLDAPRTPRVGASFVFTDTTMLFGEGRRADMQRASVFASLAYPTSKRFTFEASLGGLVGGRLETSTARSSLGPGAVTSLGFSMLAVDGRGSAPLVVLGLTASGSFTRVDTDPMVTRAGRTFEAYDLRASALVGKTIADVATPYVLARAFGGPAFWRFDDGRRVQGTDLYKYQLGGGLALTVDRLDVFVEGAALGERSLAGGLGVRL